VKLEKLFQLFGFKLTIERPIMSPALLALILSLVEEAIAEAPAFVMDLKTIFDNAEPTPADWEALRAKVLAKSYADYVPASALNAATAAAAAPAVQTPLAATAAPATAVKTVPVATAGPAANPHE
jgi:hypothetical protein